MWLEAAPGARGFDIWVHDANDASTSEIFNFKTRSNRNAWDTAIHA
jgi:hypothetical protein